MKKQACFLRHSDAKSVRTAAGTNADLSKTAKELQKNQR